MVPNFKIRKAISGVILTGVCFLCACGRAGADWEAESSIGEALFPDYAYDDGPQYYAASHAAVSEDGYYYISNKILYFYDVAADVASAVCSKAECSHDTSRCDAYVQKELSGWSNEKGELVGTKNFDREKGVNCGGNMIFYHEKHLYMIERKEDGDYLVRYDSRFNNRERLAMLAGDGSIVGCADENDMNGSAFLAGGYLYYMRITPTLDVAQTDYVAPIACCRVKLQPGAEPEKLGEFDLAIDTFGKSGKIIGIGTRVYYIAGVASRLFIKKNCGQYRVAVYDAAKGSFEMVLRVDSEEANDAMGEGTGRFSNFYICAIDEKNNLYVSSNQGSGSQTQVFVWKYSLDTLQMEKVLSLGNVGIDSILYNEEKVYVCYDLYGGTGGGKIYCMDTKNNNGYEIQTEKQDGNAHFIYTLLAADARYLVASARNWMDEKQSFQMVIPVKDIKDGQFRKIK